VFDFHPNRQKELQVFALLPTQKYRQVGLQGRQELNHSIQEGEAWHHRTG
jgi:hypothetical protein